MTNCYFCGPPSRLASLDMTVSHAAVCSILRVSFARCNFDTYFDSRAGAATGRMRAWTAGEGSGSSKFNKEAVWARARMACQGWALNYLKGGVGSASCYSYLCWDFWIRWETDVSLGLDLNGLTKGALGF